MPPTWICVDLDGTCVRYDPRFELDPSFLDTITPLVEAGVPWVMNSDRPREHMAQIAAYLPESHRPRALLSRQQEIHVLSPTGEYAAHADWNHACRTRHEVLWADIQPEFPRWHASVSGRFNILSEYINDDAFAFCVAHEETEPLRALLREMIRPWPDAQVSGNEEWSFVLHASFSKRAVLDEAARALDLPPDAALAIGDGINDLTMLDGSITPFVGCPSNACDDAKLAVRNTGGVIARGEAGSGSAEVIRHFFDS